MIFIFIFLCVFLLQFEFLFEESVTDVQLAGAKFLDNDGNSFAVTGYDSSEVAMFSKWTQKRYFTQ